MYIYMYILIYIYIYVPIHTHYNPIHITSSSSPLLPEALLQELLSRFGDDIQCVG